MSPALEGGFFTPGRPGNSPIFSLLLAYFNFTSSLTDVPFLFQDPTQDPMWNLEQISPEGTTVAMACRMSVRNSLSSLPWSEIQPFTRTVLRRHTSTCRLRAVVTTFVSTCSKSPTYIISFAFNNFFFLTSEVQEPRFSSFFIIYLFIYGCVGSLFLCEGFL